MSHLFTVKAVQKTDGLDTVTTLHYTTKPYITTSANGGYRVQFEDVNAAPHASPIIFLVGTVNPPREWVKEGETKPAPDEEFFDNVYRAEAVYIENMAGATVQSLKSNIVKPTPFPEEDRLKNEAIRAGIDPSEEELDVHIIQTQDPIPKYINTHKKSIKVVKTKPEATRFINKRAAVEWLEGSTTLDIKILDIVPVDSANKPHIR